MASARDTFPESGSLCLGYGVAQDMAKAEEEFKTAVSQSIALYYYYDSIGSGENCRRYDAPTDEEIADFANAKWNSTAYVDKLDAIITQKWLHFGFLVSREAWSDIRRTAILRDWCSRKCRVLSPCAEPLEIPQHGSELQSVL